MYTQGLQEQRYRYPLLPAGVQAMLVDRRAVIGQMVTRKVSRYSIDAIGDSYCGQNTRDSDDGIFSVGVTLFFCDSLTFRA